MYLNDTHTSKEANPSFLVNFLAVQLANSTGDCYAGLGSLTSLQTEIFWVLDKHLNLDVV